MDFVVFSSVLLPYLWIYNFCCWYILRFSRIYVRSSSVFIIRTLCLLSLVCPCFVVVYLLFISFARPLFSLFKLRYVVCFLFLGLCFHLFVCLLNRKKGFCCLFFSVLFLFVVPSASVFTFLSVLVVCLFLLFYSLFLCLLSPLYSSVFTFPVCPCCCFIFCLIYYLF